MTDTSRDEKGKFRKGVSGNRNGRPVGSKGKFAKAKLENMLNKAGPEALQLIMDSAKKLLEKGELVAGSKLLIPVMDKWYTLTVHNDRIQIAEEKDKKAQLEDEEDNSSYEGNVFQVSFSSTAQ